MKKNINNFIKQTLKNYIRDVQKKKLMKSIESGNY